MLQPGDSAHQNTMTGEREVPQCRRIVHDPGSQRIEIDVGHRLSHAKNARQAFITAMHAIEEKLGGKNRNVRQEVKLKS